MITLTTDGAFCLLTVAQDAPSWSSLVLPDAEPVTITVDTSDDCAHWRRFCEVTMPHGLTLQIIEPGERMKFYRVAMQ